MSRPPACHGRATDLARALRVHGFVWWLAAFSATLAGLYSGYCIHTR